MTTEEKNKKIAELEAEIAGTTEEPKLAELKAELAKVKEVVVDSFTPSSISYFKKESVIPLWYGDKAKNFFEIT